MHVRPSRSFHVLFAVIAALASVLVAPRRAEAQEGIRLQVNWDAFAATYRALATQGLGSESREGAGAANGGVGGTRIVSREESPWLGGGMVVSLVARDWQGATRLVGGPLAVTDAIRTSRASRMVVARIGLGGGRIVPFIHLGAGQWRDPNQHVYDAPIEVAGEAGGGIEAKLTRRFVCAIEYDYTTLYHETPQTVAPVDEAVFAVARFEY